jgi:HAD superfamily hydrolase (TIGR01509 family)
MNIENKEIFIFDFDKTICTLEADWKIWGEQRMSLVKKYDPLFPEEAIDPETQNDRFKKYGKDFKKDAFYQNLQFESAVSACTPIEPVIALIKNLTSKELYIWSSNSKETVQKHLKNIGILDKFKMVISFEDVEFIKPNPDGFKYIQQDNLDLDLSKIIFIGDSVADKGAAETVGVDFLNVADV